MELLLPKITLNPIVCSEYITLNKFFYFFNNFSLWFRLLFLPHAVNAEKIIREQVDKVVFAKFKRDTKRKKSLILLLLRDKMIW